MDATELHSLLPGAIGFFAIGDNPGVIQADHQGWIFEGEAMPRPITQSEARKNGGVTIGMDEAAELFSLQPNAVEFLKDNKPIVSTVDTKS